jgi:hypothetical protein
VPILLQKPTVIDDVVRPFHLGRRGLAPRPRRSLPNATLSVGHSASFMTLPDVALRVLAHQRHGHAELASAASRTTNLPSQTVPVALLESMRTLP